VRGKLTTTKNGKERTVPISTDLRAALDELAEQRHIDKGAWTDPDFVFVSPQGKRWDERNFARAFDRLRRKAHKDKSVRNLSFHSARHTFASWALEGGRSIAWVQHCLGHGSPEVTCSPSAGFGLQPLLSQETYHCFVSEHSGLKALQLQRPENTDHFRAAPPSCMHRLIRAKWKLSTLDAPTTTESKRQSANPGVGTPFPS
jgi:hypothetical protein